MAIKLTYKLITVGQKRVLQVNYVTILSEKYFYFITYYYVNVQDLRTARTSLYQGFFYDNCCTVFTTLK